MQQSETLIERLQKRLAGELPGIKSWERMAVKSQKGQSIESESLQKYSEWLTKEKMSVMKKAGVLIGLFQKSSKEIEENCWPNIIVDPTVNGEKKVLIKPAM